MDPLEEGEQISRRRFLPTTKNPETSSKRNDQYSLLVGGM